MSCASVVNCQHYLFVTSVRMTHGKRKTGSSSKICRHKGGPSNYVCLRPRWRTLHWPVVDEKSVRRCENSTYAPWEHRDIRHKKVTSIFRTDTFAWSGTKSFSHVYWLLPTVGFGKIVVVGFEKLTHSRFDGDSNARSSQKFSVYVGVTYTSINQSAILESCSQSIFWTLMVYRAIFPVTKSLLYYLSLHREIIQRNVG